MRSRNRHPAVTLNRVRSFTAPWLFAALLIVGCQFDGGSLFNTSKNSGILAKHLAGRRPGEAQQHWDDVRGGIQLQLAENQFRAGRLDEAEKTLEQALTLAPDNPKAHLLAARLHLERGDLAKARDAVDRAVILSGGDVEAEYVAGIVAERYGHLSAALEHYAAAAAQAPQVAAYVLAQAETLTALDRSIEALELIESRIGDFDGNASMRMLAAHLHQGLGLRGPAADYAREAVRIQEEDPVVAAQAGRILVWAGQYDDAVAILRPLVEKALSTQDSARRTIDLAGPLAPSVLRDLASAYAAGGQWREVQWALKPVMAHDDNDVAAWALYTRAALMLDDLDIAAEAVRALQANNPHTPEPLLLAAYVALRQGAPEQAVEAAGGAIRMNERLFTAHCLMGLACEALGRLDRAEESYAKAASLEPDSQVAGVLLERLRKGMEAAAGGADRQKPPIPRTDGVAAGPREEDHLREAP